MQLKFLILVTPPGGTMKVSAISWPLAQAHWKVALIHTEVILQEVSDNLTILNEGLAPQVPTENSTYTGHQLPEPTNTRVRVVP